MILRIKYLIVFTLTLKLVVKIHGIQVLEDIDAEGGGPSLDLVPPTDYSTGCCSAFPDDWIDRVSSIHPDGGCIILCDGPDCGGRCEMFTELTNDFTMINFNDVVKSYKACTCKKPPPPGIKRIFVCRGFPLLCFINRLLSQYWPYLPWIFYPMLLAGLIPALLYNLYLFFKEIHVMEFDIDEHKFW